MTGLIQRCLPSLDEIEAAYIRDCWLRQPKVWLPNFAKAWNLSAKGLTELRSRVMFRLAELLASKDIRSVVDVL